MAFKETVISNVRCLAVTYTEAAKLMQVEENVIIQHLQKQEGSAKVRLQFLSKDSPTDFFKATNGKDIVGKSQPRQCYCVPINIVPENVIQTIRGKTKTYNIVQLTLKGTSRYISEI